MIIALMCAHFPAYAQGDLPAKGMRDHNGYIKGYTKPKKMEYCQYEYKLGRSKRMDICSMMPLSAAQQKHLDDQFGYTLYLYSQFVKERYGLTVPRETDEIFILYVITEDVLNDRTQFSRTPDEPPLLGRYYPKVNWLFITPHTFTPKGYTDFPHELAHWMNEDLQISDWDLNEQMAREFETYFVAKTADVR